MKLKLPTVEQKKKLSAQLAKLAEQDLVALSLRMEQERLTKITQDTGTFFMYDNLGFGVGNGASNPGEKPTPQPDLDLSYMDKVIIPQESRDEILSVLRQHKNQHKIFEEWGLGATIEYGRGMTFLFHGNPGTGKTWCATNIAKSLGVELSVMGASEIQSSEPGGANRAIEVGFKEATRKKSVLFLDECDSLITVRSAVGMVIGSEINTLLTEIEKFEGVLILATNRIDTLDPALERRISLIVEFQDPSFTERRAIWKFMIPKKLPLAKNVSLEELASHNLTGGQIKNILLNAARMAASQEKKEVDMSHFLSAITRLNQSKFKMGTYSSWSQISQRATKAIVKAKGRTIDKAPDFNRDNL